MSSGSLKDVVRALAGVLSSSKAAYPLPEHTQEALGLYVDKHEDIDDRDSQRLHDELLNLHARFVGDDPNRRAAFLTALRLLRPAITGEDRLMRWWKMLLQPALNSLDGDAVMGPAARELLLSILDYDDDEDEDGDLADVSTVFAQEVLDMYLEKTTVPGLDLDCTVEPDEGSRLVGAHLESVLVEFGRKKPKNLLTAIDTLLEIKEHRRQALSLLCAFVRLQPPNLDQVLETRLVDHLLQCLMIDTSTTVMTLALYGLVMLLPHIPGSLVPYLPRLFIVYSRLLCWRLYHGHRDRDEDSAPTLDGHSDASDDESPSAWTYTETSWDKLNTSFPAADSSTPDLTHFFSFLYGLYPLNFMGFIRKPNRYLRNARFSGLDKLDLDQDAIRQHSEQYRQLHLLHPNFYGTTIEAELSDLSRFMGREPSDIVAQCLELCVAVPQMAHEPGSAQGTGTPAVPEGASVATDDIPRRSPLSLEDEPAPSARVGDAGKRSSAANSAVSRYSTASVSHALEAMVDTLKSFRRASEHGGGRASPALGSQAPAVADSPTLPAHLGHPHSESKLREMLHTQELLRSLVRHAEADGSRSRSPARRESSSRVDSYLDSLTNATNRSPAVRPISVESSKDVALLQREVMLLRNDLNFERCLQQQHISHIGQLQRNQSREATADVETQNIINTNRILRARAEEAKKAYAALKKETAASRNQARKREGELSAKARMLREQQKRWEFDEENLRHELQEARDEANHLRGLLMESEARELTCRQKMETLERTVEDLENLHVEVVKLDERLRDYEEREEEFEQGRRNEEMTIAQMETAKLKLQARDGEREKMKKGYEQRIAELEARLRSSQSSTPTQNSQALQAMIDSALASSRSRFENLKKVYNRLLSRHADLEVAYMDLQAAAEMRGTVNGRQYSLKPVRENFDPFGEDDDKAETPSQHHQAGSSPLSPYDELLSRTYSVSHTETTAPASPNRPLFSDSQYSQRSTTFQENGVSGGRTGHMDSMLSSRKKRSSEDAATASTGSLHSGGKSERSGSQETKNKQKIKPNSGVRVYGRGGVQNIGKKEKQKKDKNERNGASRLGFRAFGM